ncbi:helix-turn-helix domain-containing protein [Frankia sp. Ag45/Mut15]|uniref:Helix-turn-helix domain-containing protein n=1 Tax=Frankia umida TaxID=573489 RepID=A0ABT0JXQ9_9ACTN|nr:helix-turn-helix domain-containing protein [Frankia umida]MCK9876220.1 helix-turn-helix domain-containing protein [Frankia umida]
MQSVDDPQPASAGSQLAAARRERGLTVDEVSERTRVRVTLIEEIERDDYAHCGGTVYARGHLRSIATTLGLEPGPVLAAYDATHESVAGPVLVVPPGEFDPLRGSSRGGGRTFRWGTAMIVSLLAVCLVAIVILLLPGGDSSDSSDSARQGQPSTPASEPAAPPPSASAPPPTTSAPAGVNLVLTTPEAQSWLEVRDDQSHILLSQLLQSGDSRTITAPGALRIRMGNAGAVALSCNGRALGSSGGEGQVVTITVSAADSGGCEVGDGGGGPAALATAPSTSVN